MTESLPFLVLAYRTGLALLEPLAAGLLTWRERRGLEDASRLGERRGHPGRARPEGPLVWMHGASVGETLALLPVVERVTLRGIAVLLTSGTRTSAALIVHRLPPRAFHQFTPLDVPRYVRRFLDHWQPGLFLVAESELWPSAILELDARGIPLVLVNGRISERSFRRWRRLPRMIGALLQRFSLCLAQTPLDAERLAGLGAKKIAVSGNLKFDAYPPPADPASVARLSGELAGRPIWLAASTHPGEEETILSTHRALMGRHPGLLTMIAPRHPHRGGEIAELAARAGLRARRRSQDERIDAASEVYVADTIGEMGLFYRTSPLVVMGGSLVPHGGQNPFEPAKLGAAILHGPHVHNFADIYALLDEAGGARLVRDGAELTAAVQQILADPAQARAISRAAGEAVASLGGAVERTLQAIEPFLLELQPGPGSPAMAVAAGRG